MLTIEFKNEDETALFARDLALITKANDIICLNGDLGAGKTAFARHFIRAVAENDTMDVPSPTFTLMQVYETKRFPIVHADLYRLKSPDELADLGWDETGEGAVILVEWAERMGDLLTSNALNVNLTMELKKGVAHRTVSFTASPLWEERLQRLFYAREFLANSGWGQAVRLFMNGDASSRTYERLTMPRHKAVFMNAPVKEAGAAKSYTKIAKLAEDMTPFVAISEGLRGVGLSAPLVEVADIEQGFLILEDLGGEGVINAAREPIFERYIVAIEALAALHSYPVTNKIGTYTLPPFDESAMKAEIELLLEWYLPHINKRLPSSEKVTFLEGWKPLLKEMAACQETYQETWVLRDYHSPNLIWLPEREGLERIGIIDFQDAVMGHKAYDVVSLTQDARVHVSNEMESKLLAHYVALRSQKDPSFDKASFARGYAIMGAQRATKILGIFARLNMRDSKPAYLPLLPRIKENLFKNLRHPALKEVAEWCSLRLN